MNPTRIKVCGITTPEDAVACDALGVDHLGVIFADSPRKVTPERAREIQNAVPRASLIGVFANEDLGTVAEVANSCSLHLIQLHGEESPAYCEALFAATLRLIVKTFRRGEVWDPCALDGYRTTSFFLFDLDKGGSGGDGAVRGLWAEAARAGRRGHRIFLAGGLKPSNVREAIQQTAPYAVDVCRGVEKVPGVKDIDAVRSFIKEVRR